MLTKEECEKACLYLLGHCYEEKEIEDGLYEFKPSGFKESEIFKELINKYFELKEKLEKNCLVSNMARDIEKLEKALDKTCGILSNTELKTTCDDKFKECKENHCIGRNCVYSRPLTKEEWEKWCFKDE